MEAAGSGLVNSPKSLALDCEGRRSARTADLVRPGRSSSCAANAHGHRCDWTAPGGEERLAGPWWLPRNRGEAVASRLTPSHIRWRAPDRAVGSLLGEGFLLGSHRAAEGEGALGTQLQAPPNRNRLLGALPPAVLEQLGPDLEPVVLEVGQVLVARNGPQEWVYFPTSGLASRLLAREDGPGAEVTSLGLDGLSGVQLVLGESLNLYETVVQIAGEGWRVPARAFVQHFGRQPFLRRMVRRYLAVVFAQTSRQAICKGHHTVRQRLACWLLMASDRTGLDTVPVTHDLLARLLGTRRAGVTMAADSLRRAGFIAYRRGAAAIVNRRGLEQVSCGCWRESKEDYRRLIGVSVVDEASR